MYTRSKLALAGLAAALLMAFATSSAGARSFSSSTQNVRATWSALTFFGEGGIEATVRCPVTLEASFHWRTIVKTIGALIGTVTRAIIGTRPQCTGGAATILRETLPWHITYEGFTGTLPDIASIKFLLRRMAYLGEIGLATSCVIADNGEPETRAEIALIREAGGAITGARANESIRLPRVSGTFGCPVEVGFTGTSNPLTVLGTTTRVTVTLI